MNNQIEFNPIIKKKTSLEEKKVQIKGDNNFSRSTTNSLQKEIEQGSSKKKESSLTNESITDQRYKASLTQKISPSVNLKLNTLKPFLGDLENMSKPTINDIVDLLLDNYVNTRLQIRQQEAFQSMYKTQFELLKK